tara:strand:- start:40827 stop:41615 length:789 start_codon:yes stop_codon:yes gene_type:complete
MPNKFPDIFLDSGAFSAYKGKVVINIDEYIAFIKEEKNALAHYAVLDVIGDSVETYKNQKYMESKGLNPVPCFHFNEDEKWLEKYLDGDYDYIALGGMVPVDNHKILIPWLDKIWGDYLVKKDGMPKVKIHGFGIGAVDVMLRYPWYSTDSTTWVMTGRHGGVFVPAYDGKTDSFVYNKTPWKLNVSDKSPSQKEKLQHYNTLPDDVKINIIRYFKEQNFTFEELSTNYRKRDEINVNYFKAFEKANTKVKPFKLKTTRGFF